MLSDLLHTEKFGGRSHNERKDQSCSPCPFYDEDLSETELLNEDLSSLSPLDGYLTDMDLDDDNSPNENRSVVSNDSVKSTKITQPEEPVRYEALESSNEKLAAHSEDDRKAGMRSWYRDEWTRHTAVLKGVAAGMKPEKIQKIHKESDGKDGQQASIKFDPPGNLTLKDEGTKIVDVLIRAGPVDKTGQRRFVPHVRIHLKKMGREKKSTFSWGTSGYCVVAAHKFLPNEPVMFADVIALAKDVDSLSEDCKQERKCRTRVAYLDGPNGTLPYVVAIKPKTSEACNLKFLKAKRGMVLLHIQLVANKDQANCVLCRNGCVFTTKPIEEGQPLLIAESDLEKFSP